MLIAVLKINILLALFALVYYVALRRLTFYQLNRFYFLLAIGCAIAYPFIDLSFLVNKEQQAAISQLVPAMSYELPGTTGSVYTTWITAAFVTGLVIMLVRLISQFASLYKLHQKSISGLVHNMRVRLMHEEASPFSFGKHIYINPSLHTTQEQRTIVEHEKIHVSQWHTFDILLAELMLLCCWFNPAAWLMSKAMRENLEFITDNTVLQKGFDRKLYQYSLLQVSTGSSPVSIVNKFTLHDIKKRIQMMNGQRSSRLRLVSYGSFPVLIAASLLFTISVKETEELIQSFINKTEEASTASRNIILQNNNTLPHNATITQPETAPRKNIRRQSKPANTATNTTEDISTSNNAGITTLLGETTNGAALKTPDPAASKSSTEKVVQGVHIPQSNGNIQSTSPGKRVAGLPLETPKNTDPEPVVVVGYPTSKKPQPKD